MCNEIGFTIIKGNYYCPWCEMAEADIREAGYIIDIRVLTKSRLIEEAAIARMSTIPIIYHGVHLVGGYDKLKSYLDTLRAE